MSTVCQACGNDVVSEPLKNAKNLDIPFYCKDCGGVHLTFRPLGDKVIMWPAKLPSKIGSIEIPELYRKDHRNSIG